VHPRELRVLLALCAIVVAVGACLHVREALATEYTFLRTPRCGDLDPANPADPATLHPMCEGKERRTVLPTATFPLQLEYTQIAAYDTETGLVRVLVDPGLGNAAIDQAPGLDKTWIYYSLVIGIDPRGDKDHIPSACHIERVHAQTLERQRLITGGCHMSPREYAPGKIVYGWNGGPGKGFSPIGSWGLSFQLAIYDIETGAGEIIGHQSIGSVLHPFPLMNGTIAFNSLENQGMRGVKAWGVWTQFPDGRHWAPGWSGYQLEQAGSAGRTRHFAEQLGGGEIVTAIYYHNFTGGLGSIFGFSPHEREPGRPVFGHWDRYKGTPVIEQCFGAIDDGVVKTSYTTTSFAPHGLRNVVPFARHRDGPSCRSPDGTWQGKATHPAPALDGGMLMTLCVGPCRGADAPAPESDMGIAVLRTTEQPDGTKILEPAMSAADVEWIHNTDEWHEWYPRVLATYQEIYGQPAPEAIPFLPRERGEPGEPLGWIGSSSTCVADVTASETVNKAGEKVYPGAWLEFGVEPPFECDKVVGMRILAFEPNVWGRQRKRWTQLEGYSHERTRILGEVPIETDGSWVARVPADQPLGFVPINAAGDALLPAATWKKASPGEVRVDCKGCHAHSKQGVEFAGTLADAADYNPHDVAMQTPMMEAIGTVMHPERYVDVEWVRDIARHFLAEGEDPYAAEPWNRVVAQFRNLRPASPKPEYFVPDSRSAPLVTTAEFLAFDEPTQRQIRRWIGLAAPRNLPPARFPKHAGGRWYDDDYPPTVAMEVVGDQLYVGAYDLHDVSVVPVVEVEGVALELTRLDALRWTTPAPPAGTLVTVRATDTGALGGEASLANERVISRVLGAGAVPPSDPTDPPPVDPPDCPVPEPCPDCPPVPACPVPEVVLACPDAVICTIEP